MAEQTYEDRSVIAMADAIGSKSVTITLEQYHARGRELYGEDSMMWQLRCPSCGHVATPQDWKDAGASGGEVGFSCVGRHSAHREAAAAAAFRRNGGPCNYTSGGLFCINRVFVQADGRSIPAFDYAERWPGLAPDAPPAPPSKKLPVSCRRARSRYEQWKDGDRDIPFGRWLKERRYEVSHG